MLDTLERLVLLQIGAAAVTRERVQEVVNRLIEQGRMEREEGRAVVEDVLGRARERSEGTRSLIDASVQQGLRGAGVPNREAYEDLLFRVEQLEHRVRILGRDDHAAGRRAGRRARSSQRRTGHPAGSAAGRVAGQAPGRKGTGR